MCEKAARLGVDLIPHFKTHQSEEIGKWFIEAGVDAITVSSVKMAQYFAKYGWKDITIAFPLNVLEIDSINEILHEGVRLKVLVVSAESIRLLINSLEGKVEVLIEVDAGYNRTGIATENSTEVRDIVGLINDSDKLDFYGLYCHPGNTYQTASTDDIKQIWADAILKVVELKDQLSDIAPGLKIRMGDTPGCTVVEDMAGIDEIGPGNFVFYDLVMNYLDVCNEDQIAVAVACPVVAKYPNRNQLIIHGGAVHFSKDHLYDGDENKFFGEVVIFNEGGWSPILDGIKLTSISQEHGILTATTEIIETIETGDVIGILPIHSCLTANLLKSYTTLDGSEISHLEKGF